MRLTAIDPIPVEYGAAAKIFCTQVAFEVAHEAVQIHGAYGLTKESLAGKLFRDARCGLIGDGCNEVLGVREAQYILEKYNAVE